MYVSKAGVWFHAYRNSAALRRCGFKRPDARGRKERKRRPFFSLPSSCVSERARFKVNPRRWGEEEEEEERDKRRGGDLRHTYHVLRKVPLFTPRTQKEKKVHTC